MVTVVVVVVFFSFPGGEVAEIDPAVSVVVAVVVVVVVVVGHCGNTPHMLSTFFFSFSKAIYAMVGFGLLWS